MSENVRTNGIISHTGNGTPNYISPRGGIFMDIVTPTMFISNGDGSWFDIRSTGSTSGSGVEVTGVTFNNNILTLLNSTGGTLTTLIDNFSGLTVNGGISATTISATTINSDNLTLNSLSATTTATTYENLVVNNLGEVMTNKLFYIGVNFEVTGVTWNYVAPEIFKINSIDNPSGMTYSLLHNNTAYTLTNTISLYDSLSITGVSSTGFLKLNGTTI
jgi:hypothetical protein